MNAEHRTEALRYTLIHETQRIELPTDGGLISVDFLGATQELGTYETMSDAEAAAHAYLAQCGAVAQWSDVRPVETCACCQNDFGTTRWHQVLTISVDTGPEDEPQTIDGFYPARFCNACAPVVVKGGGPTA